MLGELHNVIACFTMKGDLDCEGYWRPPNNSQAASVLIVRLAQRRRRFKEGVKRAATLRPHVLVGVPAPWLAPNPARDTR